MASPRANRKISGGDGDGNNMISPVPGEDILYNCDPLLNGTIEDMSVNGATVVKEYSYTPPSGEIRFLENLNLLIIDGGNTRHDKFGALTELTNGVKIEVQSKGILHTICTLTTNTHLIQFFNDGAGLQSSNGQGYLNESNTYFGVFTPEVPIKLDQAQGDFIKMTIQDNLTGLSTLKGAALTWKVN